MYKGVIYSKFIPNHLSYQTTSLLNSPTLLPFSEHSIPSSESYPTSPTFDISTSSMTTCESSYQTHLQSSTFSSSSSHPSSDSFDKQEDDLGDNQSPRKKRKVRGRKCGSVGYTWDQSLGNVLLSMVYFYVKVRHLHRI